MKPFRLWYNPYGKLLQCQFENEAGVAEHVGRGIYLYRSAVDNQVIGFEIPLKVIWRALRYQQPNRFTQRMYEKIGKIFHDPG